jgi:hypothetical protein
VSASGAGTYPTRKPGARLFEVLATNTVSSGPVNMSIALQAYPLFAAMLESVFLGRRKSVPALAFTVLMIAGLL